MNHLHPRSKISDVFTADNGFGGKRLPRGIRRYNRRVIAQFRREYVWPKLARQEVYTPPAKPSGYGATTGLGGGNHSAAPSQSHTSPAPSAPSLPVAYDYEVRRTAKNENGACPDCGSFGEHPRKTFRLSGSDKTVELRQCGSCWCKFSGFPKPAAAPAAITFESLPPSKDKERVYHDCPVDGCREMNVDDYVLIGNAAGTQVKACKCPRCSGLFQPATSRSSIPPSNLVN